MQLDPVTKDRIIMLMFFLVFCSSEVCCHHIGTDEDSLDELEKERFDVAVVDVLFFSKCRYLIPHRLQIPWITYSDGIDPLSVRVPWLPSFVPSPILPLSDQMTFTERLENTFSFLLFSCWLPLKLAHPREEVLEKFRRYGYFRSIYELESKTALWFMSKDVALDYPRPTMPNMIKIGGLTVKRSTGELPSDIRNFIDGADNGVILVTFGSVASNVPAHIVVTFSQAFRRLEGYRVIWRLNNKDNVELPDNVMIGHWLPQNGILAHPSVKLFITQW